MRKGVSLLDKRKIAMSYESGESLVMNVGGNS